MKWVAILWTIINVGGGLAILDYMLINYPREMSLLVPVYFVGWISSLIAGHYFLKYINDDFLNKGRD